MGVSLFPQHRWSKFLLTVIGLAILAVYASFLCVEGHSSFVLISALPFFGLALWRVIVAVRQLRAVV